MKKYFILFLTVGVCFLSCKKHCLGFPDTLIAYIPCEVGDVLKYVNESCDTLELPVNLRHIDGESSYPCNAKCACEAGSVIETALNKTYSIKMKLQILIYDEEQAEIIVEIGDYYTGADRFFLQGMANPYREEDVFPESMLLEEIEGAFYRFKNVKVEKGRSIVEFWDEKYSCTWKKVDKLPQNDCISTNRL